MTQEQKIIRNKLGLLKLAQTLGSVSQACKVLASAATASIDPLSCTRRAAKPRWRRYRGRSRT